VGTAITFLSLFKELVPETFNTLDEVLRIPNSNDRETLMNLIYPNLPSLNFSKAILEQCTDRLCVMEISDICWSDWGNESRVLKDVDRLHLKLHDQGIHAFA